MPRPIITCSDCGEQKPHLAHGLCQSCYRKRRYHGEFRKRKTIAERLTEKTIEGPIHPELGTRCIEWVGWLSQSRGSDKGYGTIWTGKRREMVHRVAWQLKNGPISKGMLVLHKCDNPSCVNTDHLFLGTQKDNMRDMFKKGRNNHAKGENAAGAKLTWSKVNKIRELRKEGFTLENLGEHYGVTASTISRIVLYKTWRG